MNETILIITILAIIIIAGIFIYQKQKSEQEKLNDERLANLAKNIKSNQEYKPWLLSIAEYAKFVPLFF